MPCVRHMRPIKKIHQMSLKEKIQSDLKDAMKSGDTLRRDTLRLLDSAIKNTEIEKRSASRRSETGLTDEEILEVIARSVKQRQDSVRQFIDGGRPDLADKEKGELAIITPYLPAQLSQDEIRVAVKETIAAAETSDMGKIMGQVMAKLKGKADGTVVRSIVQEELK
jgi:uncharacterized protein